MKLHISWEELVALLPQLLPFLLPILLLHLALTAAAVISLLKKKLPFTQIAVWIAIALFASLIGPVIYFAVGSKALDEKAGGDKEKQI